MLLRGAPAGTGGGRRRTRGALRIFIGGGGDSSVVQEIHLLNFKKEAVGFFVFSISRRVRRRFLKILKSQTLFSNNFSNYSYFSNKLLYTLWWYGVWLSYD